jgi:hypothetical protein
MTDNKTYQLDYEALVAENTPDELRVPKMLAWLGVLLSPIVNIYNRFLLFKKAKEYQLRITPQVCYLEKLLNDRFDFTNRGIYIEDGADNPQTIMYARAELKPVYMYRRSEVNPKIMYTRGESLLYVNDFIIKVPASINFDIYEMTGVVRSANNLLGTKFKIQTY